MVNLVGAYTDIMDMPVGGNLSAFCSMGSVFDNAVLVHKNLSCVIYCWPVTFQLQPIL